MKILVQSLSAVSRVKIYTCLRRKSCHVTDFPPIQGRRVAVPPIQTKPNIPSHCLHHVHNTFFWSHSLLNASATVVNAFLKLKALVQLTSLAGNQTNQSYTHLDFLSRHLVFA